MKLLCTITILFLCQCNEVLLQINKKEPRIEPYQFNPKGVNGVRRRLLYPFESADFQDDIGFLKPFYEVKLPCEVGLPFYGFKYNYIRVHRDGFLTFNSGKVNMSFPVSFPDLQSAEDPILIAPWLSRQAPVEDRGDSGIYLRIIDLLGEPSVLLRERLLRDFRESMVTSKEFSLKCAIIATWKDMAMAGDKSEDPELLNTYQVVLASDGTSTYAMFNYAIIKWITHMDVKTGFNGPPAFIGFNAGNRTRSYEFRPYSQKPYIKNIISEGFGNGIKGRYYFQIDEEILRGSCIPKDSDPTWKTRPLTIYPRYASTMGGSFISMTGPCQVKNETTVVVDILSSGSKVKCSVTEHRFMCRLPFIYTWHGYSELIFRYDNQFYLGRLYLIPADVSQETLFVDEYNVKNTIHRELNLYWNEDIAYPRPFVQLSFHLWQFSEIKSIGLQYLGSLSERKNVKFYDNRFTLGIDDLPRTNYSIHTMIGFISMSTDGRDVFPYPYFWSRPFPLAWFFLRQLHAKYGRDDKWRSEWCKAWVKQDDAKGHIRMHHNLACPCTSAQAEAMRSDFIPDPYCNSVDRNCDFLHKNSDKCYITARAGEGGSGQSCCYRVDGSIITTDSSVYGSRTMRSTMYGKYSYNRPTLMPTLSFWMYEVMPLIYCTKFDIAEEKGDTSRLYSERRKSPRCTKHTPVGVATVYGDPHFLTFDGTKYTFNGKGEFVLARVENKDVKTEVQARFEQARTKESHGGPAKATVLAAIAVKDNGSETVEFRIRPLGALWRYQLFVLVDKEYIFFFDDSLRVQQFKGVTLYQQQGTWNMSDIRAVFDSGLAVEVKSWQGYMSATVYLADTPYFQGQVKGLLGTWTNKKRDDFMTPNGTIIAPNSDPKTIYESFANHWRLGVNSTKDVGYSLFHHDAVPFKYYDDPDFQPDFGNPPKIPEKFPYTQDFISKVCKGSIPCQYDFVVTENSEAALMTRLQEEEAANLMKFVYGGKLPT